MADEARESLEDVRLEKLQKIAALGHDPWGCRFDGHQAIETVRAMGVPEGAGAGEIRGPAVRVAGRIMLRRGQGKVNFLQLRDWTGAIQIFLGKNQVGDANWALAGELDLGDMLGVDGHLGYTKTGELTVFANGLTFLGKSLLPPPEKWHGLTDVEQRSRQRYVDLFSNPESMATFLGRSKIVSAFRKVLAERSFVEVETPSMQAIAGRRGRQAVRHASQRTRSAIVHENRPGIVFEATTRRRHGARFRDRAGLSQRGNQPEA